MANRPFERDRDWEEYQQEEQRRSSREQGFGQTERWGERGFGSEPEQGYGQYGRSEFGQEGGRYGHQSFGRQGQRFGQSPGEFEPGYGRSGSQGFGGYETQRAFPDYKRGYEGHAQEFGYEQGRQGQFGQFGQGMQQQRGRFAGRGPRSYRRPDERIQEDINERLTMHPDIDASEIEVIVQNAEVTLKGTVDDRFSKRLAEDIADSVFGVREVNNQVRLRQSWGGDTEREREQELTGAGKGKSK